MVSLKQKYETLLGIQARIRAAEEQVEALKSEKLRIIREFNAPVKQSLAGTIKEFLRGREENPLDISDINFSIRTGQYDDCNTNGEEGEITYEARELKLDEESGDVTVVYDKYCGPYNWGEHKESLTYRISALRRVVDYLARKYGVAFEASGSALIFIGDQLYYQERLEETDARCDGFGIVADDESKNTGDS
jgi:hypothetical protein